MTTVINLRVTFTDLWETASPAGMAKAIAEHLLETFNDDDSIYRIEHTNHITREHRKLYDKTLERISLG